MSLKNVLLFAASASAHFGLTYPAWRADTLTSDEDSGYSQWTYPCMCPSSLSPLSLPYPHPRRPIPKLTIHVFPPKTGAGVPADEGPVTDWPISGGSLQLELHHDWTYVFVNLGLGTNVTNFNVTLTPEFWNATGSGTLCVPSLPLDLEGVKDGQEASIQVVTVGDKGSALYNCANVRLVAEAEEFGGDECKTEGIEFYVVGEVTDPITSKSEIPESSTGAKDAGDEDGEDSEGGDDESGAMLSGIPAASAAGLVFALVVGLAL